MTRRWPYFSLLAFGIAAAAIIKAIADTLGDMRNPAVETLRAADWAPLIGACSLYLLAHILRALRLAVMIHDHRVGLRDTFAAHFVAAGASLLIPFKLGEIFRVAEVARLLRSPLRALLLVWSERVLDLLAITGAMLVALLFRQDLFKDAALPILFTLGVVLGTVLAFFALPEQLESIKMLFIRRYHTRWCLHTVRAIDGSQRLLLHAPNALRRRPATLICLTAVIWALEIAALALFLPRAVHSLDATLSAATFFFSQLFPSLTSKAAPMPPLYPAALYIAFLAAALAVVLAVLPRRLSDAWAAAHRGAMGSLPAWMRSDPPPPSPIGDES